MTWLPVFFVAALLVETGLRVWLSTRQIAAVSAHRDRVPEAFRGQVELADQQKAADYTVARGRLGRWQTVIETVIKLAFTVGGGLGLLDSLIGHLGFREPLRGCVLILGVFLVLQLLDLPFVLVRTFGVEARFGFNRMSPGLFALDAAKQLLLGLVLGMPFVCIMLTLMNSAGDRWWLWAWGVWLGFTLVLTWAAPRFIAPLFNKFSAITDSNLKRRVEVLLERCGYSAAGGVYVMDSSRRSAHGNAYFTGIGRNKRIVFFDTLLSRIEVHELEAVLAHELGHFRLNHVRQRLVTTMFVVLAGLGLLGLLAAEPDFYQAFGVPHAASMALLLFMFIVPPFTFLATPLASWWSRRQELAADDFAVKYAHAADLVSALVKLYRDNATTLTPDRVHSAFYDSHPSAVDRIERLRLSTKLMT